MKGTVATSNLNREKEQEFIRRKCQSFPSGFQDHFMNFAPSITDRRKHIVFSSGSPLGHSAAKRAELFCHVKATNVFSISFGIL